MDDKSTARNVSEAVSQILEWRGLDMSIGLKLYCTECKTAVYIGTWNTYVVEEPEKVGQFLWKHRKHYLIPFDESTPYYEEWKEDELTTD